MKTTPKPAPAYPAKHTLAYQLREIVESPGGLTAYALGELTGIDPTVIRRFLNGGEGSKPGTMDRLAGALGLRLVEVGRKPRPQRTGRPRPGVDFADHS